MGGAASVLPPTHRRKAGRKMADALVHGKALRIEGGPVQLEDLRCCRATANGNAHYSRGHP